jgi:UDP-N-acetylglucosamine:LPS N-acetylglucosamine transferase
MQIIPPKPTVLILSSYGGGAHESSRKIVEELLGENGFQSKTIYPIQTTICGIQLDDQHTYNTLIQKNHLLTLEILRALAKQWFKKNQTMKRSIERAIDESGATLMVSLIPFVNYVGIQIASKRSIPYILIAVDRDLRNYLLPKKIPEGVRFSMLSTHVIKRHPLSLYQRNTGFAIRKEFLTPVQKSSEQIKEELGLLGKKHIVLLMMGAAGSDKIYQFAKLILMNPLSEVHLVAFCGRNKEMIEKIESIEPFGGNSVQGLGFTEAEKIAKYMTVASLLITKPGPMSIEEAVQMKCFVLLDQTQVIPWEKENIEYALGLKIGYAFRSNKELLAKMNQHLETSPSYPITPPTNTFREEFRQLLFQE